MVGFLVSTIYEVQHTAPVNFLYALHEALVILKEEGLAQTRAELRSFRRRIWSNGFVVCRRLRTSIAAAQGVYSQ